MQGLRVWNAGAVHQEKFHSLTDLQNKNLKGGPHPFKCPVLCWEIRDPVQPHPQSWASSLGETELYTDASSKGRSQSSGSRREKEFICEGPSRLLEEGHWALMAE